jgi:hypothetical protein
MDQSKKRYVPAYKIGVVHAALGENDEAFAWFERAFRDRSWWLVWLKVDPMVDSLRSHLRLINLLGRVGLTAAAIEPPSSSKRFDTRSLLLGPPDRPDLPGSLGLTAMPNQSLVRTAPARASLERREDLVKKRSNRLISRDTLRR